MNKWINNRYTIIFGAILLIIIALFAMGPLFMEGENVIKLGVSKWYLDSSDRDALRIPTEDNRYLTLADDKEERIINYLPHIASRGEWKLDYMDEQKMIFIKENNEDTTEIEISYKPFKDRYVIFTYVPE